MNGFEQPLLTGITKFIMHDTELSIQSCPLNLPWLPWCLDRGARWWFEVRRGTSSKVFILSTVEAKGFLSESAYFMSRTKVTQPHPKQLGYSHIRVNLYCTNTSNDISQVFIKLQSVFFYFGSCFHDF